jgi:drug/metabolite transporter (DMT)-like permease
LLLILRSLPVFIYALTVAIESILIEPMTTTLGISPPVISAVSITLAGILLLLTSAILYNRNNITTGISRGVLIFSKSKRNLFCASLFLAIGILTWYDSISRVGASKEVLLAGPLEVIVIVILAYIFLREKLDNTQAIGVVVAIIGFFLAVLSDINFNNSEFSLSLNGYTIVTLGDIEAIISALGFATAVLFMTKLLSIHSALQVSGASLLVSGLILLGFLILSVSIFPQQIFPFIRVSMLGSPVVITALLLFAWLPFVGAFSYSVGLRRLGAALTGTIGSFSIIITLALQMVLNVSGILYSNLPENMLLAGIGSLVGFAGIFIIHMDPHTYVFRKRTKN